MLILFWYCCCKMEMFIISHICVNISYLCYGYEPRKFENMEMYSNENLYTWKCIDTMLVGYMLILYAVRVNEPVRVMRRLAVIVSTFTFVNFSLHSVVKAGRGEKDLSVTRRTADARLWLAASKACRGRRHDVLASSAAHRCHAQIGQKFFYISFRVDINIVSGRLVDMCNILCFFFWVFVLVAAVNFALIWYKFHTKLFIFIGQVIVQHGCCEL